MRLLNNLLLNRNRLQLISNQIKARREHDCAICTWDISKGETYYRFISSGNLSPESIVEDCKLVAIPPGTVVKYWSDCIHDVCRKRLKNVEIKETE